jgi:glycosyltransferase involved in cell wall biosynthesis
VDAVRFVCREVLPRLRRRRPEVAVDVVGPDPPASVRRLEGPRFRVHGYVPDLAPYYQRAHVVVVPVRFGGGIRIKLLDALGRGVPVVSTAEGAEGMNEAARAGCLWVAAGSRAFADRVLDLLAHPRLRRQMADRARAWVEENGSWERAVRRLEEIYACEDQETNAAEPRAVDGRDGT